ncbi:MAG: hypothetical protein ABIQ88_23590 [Chitinophagaceae bacterium]
MNIRNNCRKATMLIEKKQAVGISLVQQLELAVHLSRCRECKIYKEQSRQINLLLNEIFLHSTTSQQGLDPSDKEHLQQLINDALENK